MAFQLRRGTDAQWESNMSNIVVGEPAVTTDTERLFVGTGSGTYTEFANADTIASEYNTTTSYAVGDVVRHQGKLYICNTATSGTWVAANWTETTVDSLIENSIGDGEVTTAKLADSAVTTAKLATSAVTTAKLADSSVTPAKLNGVIDSTLATSGKAADAKATGDALSDLNDALDDLNDNYVPIWSANVYNGNYTGGYVNQVTGAFSSDSSPTSTYCGTEEYIPITSPFTVLFNNYSKSSSIGFRYAVYDENKQYLTGAVVDTSEFTVVGTVYPPYSYLTFTTANAKYVRFSALRAVFTSGLYGIEVRLGTYLSGYSDYVDGKTLKESELPLITKSNIVGYKPIQTQNGTLQYTNGFDSLPIQNISVKKNKVYHFYANIDSNFTSMQCGHGTGEYSLYFDIDNTNITFNTNGTVGTALPHGLTLDTYIDLMLIVGEKNTGTIMLNTLGGKYTRTVQVVNGYKGTIFVKNTGSTLTNVGISFACEDFRQPIWMFGDSYFSHTSEKRWTYHLIDWGFGRCMLNGFAGANSTEIIPEFIDYLTYYGCPKYAVWCLGMNDPDTTEVNATWLEVVQYFISVCEANQITPILATIPNTPTITNYYKNQWVKNSGYRYIDFAKAVNAEDIGASWYHDCREDNTHPNEQGAKLLALQALKDVPELMLGNI